MQSLEGGARIQTTALEPGNVCSFISAAQGSSVAMVKNYWLKDLAIVGRCRSKGTSHSIT